MIIELTGNVVFQPIHPFTIERTDEQLRMINQSWNIFMKGKKPEDYYNGDIVLVTNIAHRGNNYILDIGKTKYSDLVYIRETGNLKAHSLFVASYIVTSDNYFCVIKDKRNRINTIGGLVDILDFESNNQFDPQRCLQREIKEELGIDLLCTDIFSQYRTRFLKIPMHSENDIALYPIGVLYEIKTHLNRHEFTLAFEKKRHLTDGEVSNLMFYNHENLKQLHSDGSPVSYIEELLTLLINRQEY